MADFDAALDLEPELPAAYDRRALARSMLGDTMGAIADVQAALSARAARLRGVADTIPRRRGPARLARRAGRLGEGAGAEPETPDGQKRLQMLRRKAYGEAT